jgi:hypothetical protein
MPKQVKHRRVKIRHRNRILHRCIAEVVRRSMADSALDAAAGQQEGETLDMVIPSIAAL